MCISQSIETSSKAFSQLSTDIVLSLYQNTKDETGLYYRFQQQQCFYTISIVHAQSDSK